MLAELERDRGADHDLLPFERDGEAPHPFAPMVGGLVEHRRQHLGDVADERLVGAEEEVKRLLEPEAATLEEMDDRRVGGEAERLGLEQVADMVGARGPLGVGGAPVARRIDAISDSRRSGDGTDDPDEGDRPVHPPRAQEARAEVEDVDRGAVLIGEPGDQDRRVLEIALLGRRPGCRG